MRKLLALGAIGACLAFSGLAAANLSINKLWVEFKEGDQERNDLIVRNDSEDRYYVTISVAEILNAGTDAETKVAETDPEKLGLLVTPSQLVLEPGALRSIRLVSLNKDLVKDRIYRVLVAPQVGAIKARGNGEESRGIAIKMLAAYDVLVIDKPVGAAANIQSQRFPDHVSLTNAGNTNILIAEGYVCPATIEKDPTAETCQRFEAKRLYSGGEMTLALKAPTDRVFVKTRTGPAANFVEQIF
ncbi:MAG: hypothetical protein HEQ22_05150 [Sphingopyxis sp.]|uniref:fimbrial biogenesis chaperone n=1 Tax=Sphingopyxis sp. TaxID=1908224 RepID=UPI003D80BD59